MTDKVWNILEEPPQDFFDKHPELPKVVAHLLYHRDVRNQEDIDEFLNPEYSKNVHDPFLFNEMDTAIERIFEAIKNEENIIIFGDYDADGVSSATILKETLDAIGSKNHKVYLPHREKEGYGLNKKSIKKFAKQEVGLIITCDCGISDTEEIKLANEKNIDVIITDHHSIPDQLPEAFAILHPKIEDEKYPDQNLSGGGVAFKLAQALIQKRNEQGKELSVKLSHEGFEKWLLDMVAIANVADMVPLKGEARTLTKYGLLVLNKTKRIGIKKLLREAGIMDNDGTMKNEIDSGTIGYRIAPRINAAGRLNHANVAYKLMTTDKPIEAEDLAFELNKNNKDRQQIVKKNVKTAKVQVQQQKDQPIFFVKDNSWKPGVVGLIASKIKEEFHKPTIAMTFNDGEMTGSGRSIKGFSIIEALQDMPHHFSTFGGHPMACGFTLKEYDILEQFQQDLIKKYKEKFGDKELKKQVVIDAEIDLDQVNWDLHNTLKKFEPFGKGNKKPTYLAKSVTVKKLKSVGSSSNHLKMMVTQNSSKMHNMIGWNLCTGDKNWGKILQSGDKIDVVFEIGVNEWRGNRNLQLTIKDLRKSNQ